VRVSDQRTPVPDRVSIEDVRDLIKRRRDAGYDGTWLLNETVEALLTEAELYRLKHNASYRRQRDAARAQRDARKREPVKYDD
jgi:hypothetical protein